MKKLTFTLFALLCLGSMMLVHADTWTVAGNNATIFGTTWSPSTAANDMTLLSGNVYKFTKSVNFSSNTGIQFKVCKDHGWGTAYPKDNYSITIPSGQRTLLITFNSTTQAVMAYTSMTVAGDNSNLFGTTWAPTNTANDMTLQSNGTYTFSKEHVELSAGTITFKACANHAWDNAWPSANYELAIAESGLYTVSITFNPATLAVSAEAELEEAVAVIPTIQLHSNITNSSWASSAEFVVAANEETASLTLTNVTKGNYEFGVKIDGTWTSNGSAFTRANHSHAIAAGSDNCTFNADRNGDYTFTWTYETNTLDITYPAIPAQSVELTGLASQILKGTAVNFTANSSGIDNPGYRFYVKEKGGSYGSAVTSYTFNSVGEFVVKVDALEENAGDPVASDETEVAVYDAHTFTNGTKLYVDFSAMTEGTKGVNFPYEDQTSNLNYDGNGAGTVKTITFSANVEWTTNDDFIKTEKNGWAGLKFTVPAAGQDLVIVAADGASYTWGKYLPTIKMHGNFLGEWGTTAAFTPAAGNATASLTLNIQTKGEKEFGMRIGSDDNWTANGATLTRANSSAVITADAGNCKLNVDAKGNYTFTWTYETNTLSVLYPDLPTQTVEFDGLAAQILKGTNVVFAANSSGIDNPGYRFYVKQKGGEYGDAVTSYTFAALGEFVVKVAALEDNTGEPVALDEEEVAVYDAYTFTSGTTIYVDFSAMTDGAKGVNYPFAHVATSEPLDYDANGAGTIKTVTFTEDVAWSTLNDFIKTEKAGWTGLKFMVPANGKTIAKVAADGASYTWVEAAEEEGYERNGLTIGNYGTICLPRDVAQSAYTGAEFYKVVERNSDYITLEEVTSLVAGEAYIFKATAGTLTATYSGETALEPAEASATNVLQGSFTDNATIPAGCWFLTSNMFYQSTGTQKVDANRAYLTNITPAAPAPAPERKRVNINIRQTPTAISNSETDETVTKVIINESVYIRRNGHLYNMQGQMIQ